MRAVATGLSFSDILQTDDTLVVLTDMTSDTPPRVLLPLEEDLWRDPVPTEARVRVIAGARIRELNSALADAGLAFENLGGYDGQTLIGAISTSTHGSGLYLGPLPSMVRSLDLVTTDGALYRIEPEMGITDPDKFRRRYGASMILKQNDRWFRSCVVSLGCMGVIYSATVAVRPSYRLIEHKRLSTWSRTRSELAARTPFGKFRHLEVYVNPYRRRDGDYSCLVVERNIARPEAAKIPVPESRLAAEELVFRPTTQEGLLRLIEGNPRLIPSILEYGLEQLETGPTGHLDDSYRVYNIGKINTARVLSGEYFLPMKDNVFLAAVQRLLDVIEDNRRQGVYQTAPLSLRFVKASDAYLSMAYARETCALEIAMFTEEHGAREALLSYEQALYEFDARPHWGQSNELTGTKGWLRSAYGEACQWLSVYRELNHKGVFDNAFTDRMGLSKEAARCPR
jgi:hypothetical protein